MAMRRPRIGLRRAMALLVLAGSCVALLATSQPPDESHLTVSRTLMATLTADAPRAAGAIRITTTAEALPLPSETVRDVSGRLRLSASGVDRGTLVVSVEGSRSPLAPATEYGATVVPVDQLCPVGEPCDAEVTVAVEWLGAQPGTAAQVGLHVALDIVYHGVMENPQGASASLDGAAELAPADPGPSLEARTTDEQIVLDRDHWAAGRHVSLSASPEVRGGHALAFLDRTIGQLDEGAVLVTIVPDEERGEAFEAGTPFDPFAGCPTYAACERGFTVRFELAMTESRSLATVRWSFGARVAFPDDEAVPAGAALGAVVDARADAALEATSLRESVSGTFVFVPDEDGRIVGQGIQLDVEASAAALQPLAFGGLPPAARAVLTLRGTAEAAASVYLESDEERYANGSRKLPGPAGEATFLFNPLRDCQIGIGCTRTIRLSVSPHPPADGSTAPIEIGWELDVVLAYPALDEVPSLARVILRQLPGGG